MKTAGNLIFASAVIGGFGLAAWAVLARDGRDLDEAWGFGEPFVPEGLLAGPKSGGDGSVAGQQGHASPDMSLAHVGKATNR
jgi:hypothetical protein